MSVIAWDGESVVADRRMSNGYLKIKTTKLFCEEVDSTTVIVGIVGDYSAGLDMLAWLRRGRNAGDFPAAQTTDRNSSLVLFSRREAFEYQRSPRPTVILRPPFAWGSGAELALGAMCAGADARAAARIACRFNSGCGDGFDEYKLDVGTRLRHQVRQ